MRRSLPGLAFVAVGVVLAFAVGELVDISPLVGGVVLGVIAANVGLIRPALAPGLASPRSGCSAPASSPSDSACRSTRFVISG